MRISRLRLHAFRNYADLLLLPAGGVTVLHGENAQGKTNIIEAIYLCCVGRSHRTSRDAELIRFGEAAAQVSIEVERREGAQQVSVRLSASERRRKLIRINETPVQRIGELMGHVNAVLFSPEDLRIVKEGPDGRRRFLDMEISQLQPAYFYALQRYHRALVQRNGLLKQLAFDKDGKLLATLEEWDALLIEEGAQIIARRRAFLKRLEVSAQQVHETLSGGKERLALKYQGRAEDGESLRSLVKAARREDLRRATTTVGPHRDDYRILLNGRDAKAFASQGQQRSIALSLKLAEIDVMREALGESPVLLLDDVMSELDVTRRRMLLTRIERVQTLITCTHLSDLGGAAYEAAYRIENGTLTEHA